MQTAEKKTSCFCERNWKVMEETCSVWAPHVQQQSCSGAVVP